MKINLDLPTEEARIEMIPLIDVIFCILTFFLLAALQLTRQQGISVDLPQASSGVPQMREMLMITLDDFGQVYVEQQKVSSKEQLAESLKNYRATNPSGLMVLYAARTTSYNDVVQILDFLRSIGGDRVALATLPDAAAPTATPTPVIPPTQGLPGVQPNPGFNPNQPALPNQVPGLQGVPPNVPSNVPLAPNVVPPGQGSLLLPNPGATGLPGQGLPVLPNAPNPGATVPPQPTAPAPNQ